MVRGLRRTRLLRVCAVAVGGVPLLVALAHSLECACSLRFCLVGTEPLRVRSPEPLLDVLRQQVEPPLVVDAHHDLLDVAHVA